MWQWIRVQFFSFKLNFLISFSFSSKLRAPRSPCAARSLPPPPAWTTSIFSSGPRRLLVQVVQFGHAVWYLPLTCTVRVPTICCSYTVSKRRDEVYYYTHSSVKDSRGSSAKQLFWLNWIVPISTRISTCRIKFVPSLKSFTNLAFIVDEFYFSGTHGRCLQWIK
jgi:hypothetical protein